MEATFAHDEHSKSKNFTRLVFEFMTEMEKISDLPVIVVRVASPSGLPYPLPHSCLFSFTVSSPSSLPLYLLPSLTFSIPLLGFRPQTQIGRNNKHAARLILYRTTEIRCTSFFSRAEIISQRSKFSLFSVFYFCRNHISNFSFC
jgi:hypothetical protein